MSRINDALRQAQKEQPAHPTDEPPRLVMAKPIQPSPSAQGKSSPGRPLLWVISIVAIGGIGAVVFLAGWMPAKKLVNQPVAATGPATPTIEPSATVPPPATEPVAAAPGEISKLAALASLVIKASDVPRVQGIFYVPGKSTAILDGTTVRVGDRFQQYQVKDIAKTSVTLVTAEGKIIQLAMAN